MTAMRTRTRRAATWVAGVAALAVALAGCTDAGDPDPDLDRAPAPTSVGGGEPRERLVGSPLGAKWDSDRFTEFEPFLQTLGGPTFTEVVWCDVEPTEGARDWSAVDLFVRRGEQVAETVMLKIRVGQCWATGQQAQKQRGRKTESGVPADTAAYEQFVTELVTRYAAQGVHRFAVENEVNSESFWAGTTQEYRELVEVASAAIRAADPEALVLDSGLSSVSNGYGIASALLEAGDDDAAIDAWNTYYARRIGTRGRTIPEVTSVQDLRTALGTDQGVRSLEHSALAAELVQEGLVDVRQVHFYEPWQAAPLLLDHLREVTPEGTPLEVWEAGLFVRGQEVSQEQAAAETVQSVSALLAGGAALVVWLPLAFNPDGRNPDEPRTGLLDPDGVLRPGGEAYQELAAAAVDATPVPIASGDVLGVGLEGPDGTTAFVWTRGEDVPVEVEGQQVELGTAPTTVSLDGPVSDLVEQLP